MHHQQHTLNKLIIFPPKHELGELEVHVQGVGQLSDGVALCVGEQHNRIDQLDVDELLPYVCHH